MIDPRAIIDPDAALGTNVRVGAWSVIGEGVRIGDNTVIREFVTINKGTKASGKTAVGKNCLIMSYVHIAHDCVLGDDIIIANGNTSIHNNSMIIFIKFRFYRKHLIFRLENFFALSIRNQLIGSLS